MQQQAGSSAGSGWIRGSLSVQLLLSFVFGVLFITAMLVFATKYPNPTPFQFNVFIVVLALASAGVGAILPGVIGLNANVHLGAIRAGGAATFFVIVLMFRPALKDQAVSFVPPTTPAEPVAAEFLKLTDNGQYLEAWASLDREAKGTTFSDEKTMDTIYTNARVPLGTVEYRKLNGSSTMQSPPGYPIGLYSTLTYKTKFSGDNGKCRMEMVSLRATQDLVWKTFGHQVSPVPIDC